MTDFRPTPVVVGEHPVVQPAVVVVVVAVVGGTRVVATVVRPAVVVVGGTQVVATVVLTVVVLVRRQVAGGAVAMVSTGTGSPVVVGAEVLLPTPAPLAAPVQRVAAAAIASGVLFRLLRRRRRPVKTPPLHQLPLAAPQ
jgi:hypothetical protein